MSLAELGQYRIFFRFLETNVAIADCQSTDSRTEISDSIVADSLAFGVIFALALTVFQRGIGFLRGILFCRIMTDHELGQWSMVFSFLMLLAPFAVLGLPGCFGRFSEHYRQRGQIGTFVRRIGGVSTLLTFALTASMFWFPSLYSQFIFGSPSHDITVYCMAIALLFVTANNFFSTLMESLQQFRLATIMRFITGVAFAVLGTGLIWFSPHRAAAATIAFGVASLMGLLPAAFFLRRHWQEFKDHGDPLAVGAMWRRIVPYAIWLWASNLVFNLFEVTDRGMLVHCSQESSEITIGLVGQYHSGRVVPLLLVGVAVVLEGVLMPYMTALWENNRKRAASQQLASATKMVAIAFSLAGGGVLVASPFLFDVVLSGRYEGGQSVLPLTLVYSIWFSLFLIAQVHLWVAEKGRWVFAITSVGLALNLILNACLIPTFGLWGAVVATTMATLACLVMALVANTFHGCPMPANLWLTIGLPVLLLLPSSTAAIALLTVTIISVWTPVLFSQQEKELAVGQFLQKINAFLQRKR